MNQQEIERKIDKSLELVQEAYSSITENLAQALADEEVKEPKSKLLPQKALIERYKKQIGDELGATKARLKKGLMAIFHTLLDRRPEKIEESLSKLYNLADLIANSQERFLELLSQDTSLQQIAELTDDSVEAMYQAAKHLYDQKRLQEAADAFSFLTLFDTENPIFWQGLGNSEFQLKNYDNALFAYAFVCKSNPQDFMCHVYASRCYELLGDLDNALNSIQLALYVLGDDSEEKEIIRTLEKQARKLELALHKGGRYE